MSKPNSVIRDYLVEELVSPNDTSAEAPINIVCEPVSSTQKPVARERVTLRLKAGINHEEALILTNTMQARAKRPGHIEASDDVAP